jgi:L-alanine-DL-glutamate epimerase-like enolase superfamily enzyme
MLQADRVLEAMSQYGIDFVEQPVRDHPLEQMRELRQRSPIPVCANEGLWSEADAYARITGRTANVFCFSTYWVGGLDAFVRLGHVAALEGLEVCKHTHGELGLAAAAGHHARLCLPNVVAGNQQTAHLIQHDVLSEPLPMASGPTFGIPDGSGLCVEVDEAAIEEAAARYRREGQFPPWQPELIGRQHR